MSSRPRSRPGHMVPGPVGPLECLTTGSGPPRTVFVHGLGGTIATTRPFGSGVPGEKTFLHLRGFGRSGLGGTGEPGGPEWSYPAVAVDVAAVAGHQGARQALGVSLGAGALCSLMSAEPSLFERVVLVLPAVIDKPRNGQWRERLDNLSRLAEARDLDRLAALLTAEQPSEHHHRPEFQSWVRDHAEALTQPGAQCALRALGVAVPVPDPARLKDVTTHVLVIGQEHDVAHPACVAVDLAGRFGSSELLLLPPGGVFWGHRDRVRRLVAGFLG